MNKKDTVMTLRLLIILSILSSFSSCKNIPSTDNKVSQGFLDSLTERQVGETRYWISIPTYFELTAFEESDFSGFYFADEDTTILGGMYVGNPSRYFSPNYDSCKSKGIDSEILGTISKWTIHECRGAYSVQAIVDGKEGEERGKQLHFIGHGKSEGEIYKILKIYSTLRKKH